jgi:hypothetical protein
LPQFYEQLPTNEENMETKKKAVIRVRPHPKQLSLPAVVNEYEKDFSKWAHKQARFLKKRVFSKLDIDNLIEEIEDLSKREKQRLTSYLEILLMNKLKVAYQPSLHSPSWDASIKQAAYRAQKTLAENPSLKIKLKEILADAYFYARLKAVIETGLEEETFPPKCPWQLKELFPDLEKKYH